MVVVGRWGLVVGWWWRLWRMWGVGGGGGMVANVGVGRVCGGGGECA